MKANDIRELNVADLAARIAELEEERFRLRFRGATEQLEDPLRLRSIRKDIARLKTVLRERELGRDASAAKGAARTGAGR
jgi:large subunit ribosomal protein L29